MSKSFNSNSKTPKIKQLRTNNLFARWLRFLIVPIADYQHEEDLIAKFFASKCFADTQLFCDFLAWLRAELSTKNQKQLLAKRYLRYLAPILDRFGLFKEKTQLDDLCFELLNPEEYKKLALEIKNLQSQSQNVIAEVIEKLTQLLTSRNYNFKIQGRLKSKYSIYRKLKRKGRQKIQILGDIFAFRIILTNNQPQQCFAVANLLSDQFYPLPKRYKDYITVPKVNGYQSIHLGIKGIIDSLDLVTEIQIRTQSMHDFAQTGLAAHWLYTNNLELPLVTEKEAKIINYFLSQKIQQLVFFFSHKNQLFALPAGSSLQDFANHLHTEIGKNAEVGLVNGEFKPLSHQIQEGEVIQIIQKDDQLQEIAWPDYLIGTFFPTKF
jgi:(p)ppGpp synthase/HD superfamily hydrolase